MSDSYDLSCPEHGPGGKTLFYIYYGTTLIHMLDRKEHSGYPNNGGEHSLRLRMPKDDALAWIDLVQEHLAPFKDADLQAFLEKARSVIK